MDIYTPITSDSITSSLVVLAFGGGFIIGKRTDLHKVCMFLAKRGYAVATIDYRLFDDMGRFPTRRESKDAAIKGIGDVKAAIRYLTNDAYNENNYKVDVDNIVVGGVSSGAIIANHVAYMQDVDVPMNSQLDTLVTANGGINGISNTLPDYSPSQIQGVLSFSGAILDKKILTDVDVTPFFAVHETEDVVVPFGKGTAKVLGIPFADVEGSSIMKSSFDSLGVENELLVIESDGHVGYLLDSDSLLVFNKTMNFLNNLFCRPLSIIDNGENEQGISFYPNPASTTLSFSLGEMSVSSIEIFSLDGVLLKEEAINTFKGVNIEELQPGVYLLRLRTNDEALVQFKFVKN